MKLIYIAVALLYVFYMRNEWKFYYDNILIPDWKKWGPVPEGTGFRILSLYLLRPLTLIVLTLCFLLIRPYFMAKEDLREFSKKNRRNKEAKRLAEMPVVYVNYVNGIKVAVWKADYEKARDNQRRAMIDGRITKPKPLRVSPVWLFRHNSAKIAPEDLKRFTWISEFDRSLDGYRVETRSDLYVPFVSKKTWQEDRKIKYIDRHGIIR